MKILILALKTPMDSTVSLIEALSALGHQVKLQSVMDSTASLSVEKKRFDLVIPRLGWTSLKQGLRVIESFEAAGVRILNSSDAIRLADDKYATLARLARAKIPVVPTLLIQPAEDEYMQRVQHAEFRAPFFVKLPSGSQGKGVAWANDKVQLSAIVDMMRTANQEVLLQPRASGPEFRVLIFRGEVLGAISRTPAKGDLRANLHVGGSARPARLTPAEIKLCLRATTVCGVDLAGIDFIRTRRSPLMLEINAFPGLMGIGKALKQDFAKIIAGKL